MLAPTDPAIAAASSVYSSRTVAQAANIPAALSAIETLAFSTLGDGGGAIYRRSNVSGGAAFQSADGSYWFLASAIINVCMFGAKADGTTDNASFFTQAFNSGAKTVVIPAASTTYGIKSPVTVPDGVYVSAMGARVQAIGVKTGTLNTAGNHFILGNDCVIDGINILPAATAYALDGGVHAVIVMNGNRSKVRRASIDITGSVLADYLYATCVFDGFGNEVADNDFYAAGTCYTYGGGKGTITRHNRFWSPVGNAITGNGVSTTIPSHGHLIEGNYIFNPARMGIEDFCTNNATTNISNNPNGTRGTRIVHNTIICSGAVTPQYFAISAVSPQAVIEGNYILNWPTQYAVETGAGLGVTITANKFSWTDGNPNLVNGIQVQVNPYSIGLDNQVIANSFNNPYDAFKNRDGRYMFSNNVVSNPKRSAVWEENTSQGGTSIGNRIIVTTPTVAGTSRTLFTNVGGVVAFNRMEWPASANGGGAAENGVIVKSDRTDISHNTFIDGGVVSGGGSPTGITTNGNTPDAVRMIGNTFTGTVRVFFNSMTNPLFEDNVGQTISGGQSLLKNGFFGNGSIAKPSITGSRGGNAALQSIIAQLANLGLVTDSTTA